MSHKILIKYINFYQNFDNLPEMNEEYPYIFYTFFKSLQEMKDPPPPPRCFFEIYHMYDLIVIKVEVHITELTMGAFSAEEILQLSFFVSSQFGHQFTICLLFSQILFY